MATKSNDKESHKGLIRNSTADFLLFTQQSGEQSIEVRLYNENVWLTQRAMSVLFDCSVDNIALHLKNIYATGEITENRTTEDFSEVRLEGTRRVSRRSKFYKPKRLQRVNLKNIESSKIAII